jgi:ATP-dependent DNA ligase
MREDWATSEQRSIRMAEIISHGLHRQTNLMAEWNFEQEQVVEVTYLIWTEDNLLRQVSYQGQREDKPARQVVRSWPNLAGASSTAVASVTIASRSARP